MSEVNRPSASEQARADQIAADRKRVKQQDPKAGVQGTQIKAYADQNKKMKSVFDEALTKAAEGVFPLDQEPKFDSKVREAHRDQENSDREKNDQKKQKGKGDLENKSRDGLGSKHEKVIAKQDSREGRQESGSGNRQEKGGQSGSGFNQQPSSTERFLEGLSKEEITPAPNPAARVLNGSVQSVEGSQETRTLPKAVLDQIVQYVRITMKKDLGKEIEIDFRDNFFNGLRLRVISQGREISVEFIAPNRAVAETFRQERENIASHLGEKGIDVRSICVTHASA